jgi:hypothetical protein
MSCWWLIQPTVHLGRLLNDRCYDCRRPRQRDAGKMVAASATPAEHSGEIIVITWPTAKDPPQVGRWQTDLARASRHDEQDFGTTEALSAEVGWSRPPGEQAPRAEQEQCGVRHTRERLTGRETPDPVCKPHRAARSRWQVWTPVHWH